jgi:hypothetical protein
LCVGEEDPFTSPPKPLPLCVCVLPSGNGRRWVEIRVKTLKRDLMVTMELTPNKLKAFCEVDWSAFGVWWPLERSLYKTIVNEVYRGIVGKPGHPEQFLYIDCWQDAVLSRPTWLRACLEEAYRIMVARVAATSTLGRKQRSLYWLRNLR